VERTSKAPAAKRHSAAEFLPETRSLHALEEAARHCHGCDLYRFATQTVFGEGHSPARIMLVGEQPGDQEDVQGHPFVGPAGKLLGRALEQASIGRSEVYVTNAVKHFKFEREGKRRIHKKPGSGEISACRPWLEAEMETVRPKLIVCMGATASQSVLGRAVGIQKERGSFLPHRSGADVMITIHPSALLRLQTHEEREREFNRFVSELKSAKERTV